MNEIIGVISNNLEIKANIIGSGPIGATGLTGADSTVPGPIGLTGSSLEYIWTGTQLGIRVAGTTTYQYVDLIGTQGIQGIQGLSITTQYSINGSTLWHSVFAAGDIYMQVKIGTGAWSANVRLVGQQGSQGIQGDSVSLEYSINGSTLWHSTFVTNDIFAHVKIGAGTWSTVFRLVGIQGIQGIQGESGLTWRNAYVAATQYVVDDAVQYNGSSYVCILNSLGNLPTNTTYWSLLAQKGTDGLGSGDMLKATYDITNNGIVDNAEKVNGHTVLKDVPVDALFTDNDTIYTHPTGDGNLHVPATSTTNNGKVLKAGAAAGSGGWSTLAKGDVGLGSVDNTTDANKPVSTLQQNAINAEATARANADTALAEQVSTNDGKIFAIEQQLAGYSIQVDGVDGVGIINFKTV